MYPEISEPPQIVDAEAGELYPLNCGTGVNLRAIVITKEGGDDSKPAAVEESAGSAGSAAVEKKAAAAGKDCIICYDRPVRVVLLNCGHCLFCITCTRRMMLEGDRKCPVCKQFVERAVKIYSN